MTLASMNADTAETLGAEALAWIAGQPPLLDSFVDATGVGPQAMIDQMGDPEFLGFVLDFLLSDESALVAFCTDRGIAPDLPMRARLALPGGAEPHWT